MRKTGSSARPGRTAAQLAALLSLPAWELDELTARTIVMAAMEDDSIYAVKVQTKRGMLEGQRRNYQWEPVPWDDEIAENTVQGMNPLKMEGRTVGSVEVYLSPRLSAGGAGPDGPARSLAVCPGGPVLDRSAAFAALALGGSGPPAPPAGPESGCGPAGPDASAPEKIVLGLSASTAEGDNAPDGGEGRAPQAHGAPVPCFAPVNPALGRSFQRKHADAWQITAGCSASALPARPNS